MRLIGPAEPTRFGRTYRRHVSCHSLPWGITSACGLRIGWTKTSFRSSRQELCDGAIKISIWGCLSRWFICAIMPHYDLHPNIHQSSWNPLVYDPTTMMQAFWCEICSKLRVENRDLTIVNIMASWGGLSLRKILRWGRYIRLCFSSDMVLTFWLFRCMWMIVSLVARLTL
jgi:hypothetical protein